MGVEIERKFLVDREKWSKLPKPRPLLMDQGYLNLDPERTVRIRVAGAEAWLTIKGQTRGAVRSEMECTIPVAAAGAMLQEFALARIRKQRFYIAHKERIWEVDEFMDENEGLIVAELELEAEEALFEKPDWVGVEVTDDKRYYNSLLAQHPYKKWS